MHVVEWLLETEAELHVPMGTEYYQGLWKIETLFLTVVRGTGDANCYSNCGEQATLSLSASGGTGHRHSQGASAGGAEVLVS